MLRNRASVRRHGNKLVSVMIHGSAVVIGGYGVLLLGPSGSGKSDLALRLIDRGATLVSDDILHIETRNGLPQVAYAPNIAGKIEVRGVGIRAMDFVPSASLRLVIEFAQDADRMPPEGQSTTVADFTVPMFKLDPFHTSSALKVELALRSVIDDGLFPVAQSHMKSNESIGI